MATHDKNAAPTKEIDAWVNRIEEITSALDSFLKADPAEEEKRKAERAAARAKTVEQEATRRVRERYDSARYKKFEDDKWIAEMLAACDKPPTPAHAKHNDLTPFEKVTLREAEEEKTRGNAAIMSCKHLDAFNHYSNGIGMDPCDDELLTVLHNNRAQAALLLQKFETAVEDASFVLARQRHNVKALLRRATAFSALYRPVEAAEDLRRLLIADPKNVEGLKLKALVDDELVEHAELEQFKKEAAAENSNNSTPYDGSITQTGGNSNESGSASFVAGANVGGSLLETEVNRLSNLCDVFINEHVPALVRFLTTTKTQENSSPTSPSSTLVTSDDTPNKKVDDNNNDNSPQHLSDAAADHPRLLETFDAILKHIVDDLCEVGRILASHNGAALLFRSKEGLFAAFDIISLLLLAPPSLSLTQSSKQDNAQKVGDEAKKESKDDSDQSLLPKLSSRAEEEEERTAKKEPIDMSFISLRPLFTTESILMTPMAVVCLTCAFRVLSLSFPSASSRKFLSLFRGGSGNINSRFVFGAPHGLITTADPSDLRPLLTRLSENDAQAFLRETNGNYDFEDNNDEKRQAKPCQKKQTTRSCAPLVVAVGAIQPLAILGMAVAALCSSSAPSMLQSALASSATLRELVPWAMRGVMHTKRKVSPPTPPAAQCLVSLASYAPLHAACAEFLASVVREESGWIASYVFGGFGVMMPPLWPITCFNKVVESATERAEGIATSSTKAVQSNPLLHLSNPLPTLTGLLRLAHKMMSHTAEVMPTENEEADQKEKNEQSNVAKDGDGEVGVELGGGAQLRSRSVLAFLERKGALRRSLIPACLTALSGILHDPTKGETTPLLPPDELHQRRLLQEAALEAVLAIPLRCYKQIDALDSPASSSSSSSMCTSLTVVVEKVVAPLLPPTIGAFVSALTVNTNGDAKNNNTSKTPLSKNLASLSYKAEAALAIVFNLLVQANPVATPSKKGGQISDRARLVRSLLCQTSLLVHIADFIKFFSNSSRSATQQLVIAENLNVVARLLGVMDRVAGADPYIAESMLNGTPITKEEANKKREVEPEKKRSFPPVMPSVWRMMVLISADKEEKEKRYATSTNNGSSIFSVANRTSCAITTRSTATTSNSSNSSSFKSNYFGASLEHISILFASLFFSKPAFEFQKQFLVSSKQNSFPEDGDEETVREKTQQHTNDYIMYDDEIMVSISGEERLRLLLSHLKFSGCYQNEALLTEHNRLSSSTCNTIVPTVQRYRSNAVFLGNIALLLGRVHSGTLLLASDSHSSHNSSLYCEKSQHQQQKELKIAGSVYVELNAIRLGIEAITSIRSAVQGLERDLGTLSKYMYPSDNTQNYVLPSSSACESIASQIKTLRGAQKNIASMISKWLTANPPNTSAEAVTLTASKQVTGQLTAMLRDAKGFEILALSLKETS